MNNFNTNHITLKYMANSTFEEIQKNKTDVTVPSSEDLIFYKKRINSLFKKLMHTQKFPNENIKKLHLYYVNEIINYFKEIDRVELIQNEFKSLSLETIPEEPDNLDLDYFNQLLLNKSLEESKQSTLHNYVIKSSSIKQPIQYPTIKKLNIKCDKFKNKKI